MSTTVPTSGPPPKTTSFPLHLKHLWLKITLCLFVLGLGFESTVQAKPQRDLYLRDVEFALTELKKNCGHFFEAKKIDWEKVSTKFKREAKRVRNSTQHLSLLIRLLAQLKDGHASVRPLGKAKNIRWPLENRRQWVGPGMFWTQIDKKIYIKNSWGVAKKRGFTPGMEIAKVNGLTASKWIDKKTAELREFYSFSTDQQAFFYTTHWGLAAPKGTKLKLTIRDKKKKLRSRTLVYANDRYLPDGPAFLPEGLTITKDLKYGKTKDGFGYIHFRRCPGNLPEQTDSALSSIGNVPGMILDFRGNSGGGFDHDALMGQFIPKGKQFSYKKRYRSHGDSPYGGPVVVIIDATVRSAGETAAGGFSEDGRGYMIGESRTAGMSSSKRTLQLPSELFSLYVSVHSNKARFNKGKGIEGVGVIPHELVEFKPSDLAEGIDTLIQRAEELLKKFPQDKVPYNPKNMGWEAP